MLLRCSQQLCGTLNEFLGSHRRRPQFFAPHTNRLACELVSVYASSICAPYVFGPPH